MESHENLRTGIYVAKAVIQYFALEKKPLENYFHGTREKKEFKKKARPSKSLSWKEFLEESELKEKEVSEVDCSQKEVETLEANEIKKIYEEYQRSKENKEAYNKITQRQMQQESVYRLEELVLKYSKISCGISNEVR